MVHAWNAYVCITDTEKLKDAVIVFLITSEVWVPGGKEKGIC